MKETQGFFQTVAQRYIGGFLWSNSQFVIITVVSHDFHLTLSFIFAKSNSSHPLIDLIFLFILSIHMTLILSYPTFHVHYLTFLIFLQMSWFILWRHTGRREQLSTRRKEDGLRWPTRMQSEYPPVCRGVLEPCPWWEWAYLEQE